jgi:glycosyltransferase involved in cell wall biosynthesis
LTGTDLYGDIPAHNSDALQSLQLATRLIALHKPPRSSLPHAARAKTRVIFQSAAPPSRRLLPDNNHFTVCVVGHLRAVKDPFRTATAVRRLPASSRIRVIHLGMAMDESMRRRAIAEISANERYQWLGDLPHWRALQWMARCRLMVISPRMEGGPNVLSEALAMELPVLASRIAGVVGMLGPHYRGYFDVGDTSGLRNRLLRAENDERFYCSLARHCRQLGSIVDPAIELESWRQLLDELEIYLRTSLLTGTVVTFVIRGSRSMAEVATALARISRKWQVIASSATASGAVQLR